MTRLGIESRSPGSLANTLLIMVRVFANGPGDICSIPGRVKRKIQKMVLDAVLLNSIIRYGSKVSGTTQARNSAFPYTLEPPGYPRLQSPILHIYIYSGKIKSFFFFSLNLILRSPPLFIHFPSFFSLFFLFFSLFLLFLSFIPLFFHLYFLFLYFLLNLTPQRLQVSVVFHGSNLLNHNHLETYSIDSEIALMSFLFLSPIIPSQLRVLRNPNSWPQSENMLPAIGWISIVLLAPDTFRAFFWRPSRYFPPKGWSVSSAQTVLRQLTRELNSDAG